MLVSTKRTVVERLTAQTVSGRKSVDFGLNLLLTSFEPLKFRVVPRQSLKECRDERAH